MKNRKILIKYENLYLLFSIILIVTQIISHINNITFSNLLLEIIILLSLHYGIYYTIKKIRLENKKEL